jgi:hypothetical protein
VAVSRKALLKIQTADPELNRVQDHILPALNLLLRESGGSDVPASSVPVGAAFGFGGATAPEGYLLCDGAAVSRHDFAALFAVIGTTYGAGDGSTTFTLPNASMAPLAAVIIKT